MSNAYFGQFKIYPRGFLGAYRPPVLMKKAGANRSARLQYDTTLFDTNDSKVVVANTAIEDLYQKFIRRDCAVNTFDFREEVFREVLKAFGTDDFEGWLLVQFNSPSFGVNHILFIDDCLRFITKGDRCMSMNNWDAILDEADEKQRDPELPENIKFYFGREYASRLSPSGRIKIVDVVQQWVSKPGGVTDLLLTAHILFGLKQ
jgi:hypothetical protein